MWPRVYDIPRDETALIKEHLNLIPELFNLKPVINCFESLAIWPGHTIANTLR
jgi:hypothetical protein